MGVGDSLSAPHESIQAMTSSWVACSPVSSKCFRATSQLSCHAYSRSFCAMSWLIASVASAWGARFWRTAIALSFSRAVTSRLMDIETVEAVMVFTLGGLQRSAKVGHALQEVNPTCWPASSTPFYPPLFKKTTKPPRPTCRKYEDLCSVQPDWCNSEQES